MSSKLKSAPVSATVLAPVVQIIPPAPNTAPDVKKIPPVYVEQSLVDAFLNAENGVKESAVALFAACVAHRVSVAQFGARSDAKVRASEFNNAYTAGMLMGHAAARKFIEQAAALKGDKRANVLAALRRAKAASAQLKGSALKGAALAKEITKQAGVAAQAAADSFAEKAKQRRETRVPKLPAANTVAAFAPLALAALADMLTQMAKIDVKPRQLAAWKDLSETLDEARGMAELLNVAD